MDDSEFLPAGEVSGVLPTKGKPAKAAWKLVRPWVRGDSFPFPMEAALRLLISFMFKRRGSC
jgi:hypothetical protein